MNNSHLLGLAIFGVCALFAALTWFAASRANLAGSGWTSGGVRKVAVAFLLGGVGAGYGAFALDNKMRATTLFEAMVEGVGEVREGQPAPIREARFVVEHAGVEHTLMVAPQSNGVPRSDAEIEVRLLDDKRTPVLDEKLKFVPTVPAGRNPLPEWPSHDLKFTPKSAARYTLLVTPLTVGIARVHIHIADPQKRNGKRIPGY